MQKEITNKVLVLGVDERSALTVVRSLGRKGIEVHLGYDDDLSICRFSTYVKRAFKFHNAGSEQEKWIQDLKERLCAENYDLVIPTADNYLVLVVKNREQFQEFAKLAVPDNKGFEYTYEKSKTFELAASLGIPIPKTYQINNINELDILIGKIDFPVIIKPCSSKIWKDGLRYSLKVLTAHSESALRSKVKKILVLCPVLIQSFFKGIGVGIEMLMDNGACLAAFQHERVHEPLIGGGSSYRKSVQINTNLLKYSKELLSALNWTGVAMVEFKTNKVTKKSVLMEINGRFWGSLPLAYYSGVDFPHLLYELLVLNKKSVQKPFRTGLFCRNIAKDCDWFIENLAADKNDPLKISVPLKEVAKETYNIVTLNERFDTLASDDLKPGLVHLARYYTYKYKGLLSKIGTTLHKVNESSNIYRLKNNRKNLIENINNSRSILFVCKGNICRSPFAHRYLIDRLRINEIFNVRVESTGLIERVNRKSPKEALDAAQHFGIDLTQHRSSVISKKMASDFSVIYVMDTELFFTMSKRYPKDRSKLRYLGAENKKYPKEIQIYDPYGKDVDEFKKVYKMIAESIDELMKNVILKLL